ncbi:hypothetical protein SEA_MISSDAISY_64 [Mycobacterium phage MissDaisy]|nr:hypothetical protein SEA_MISSDAISY_64 [Mycobacterium phage MissDaisy]
MRIVGPAKPAEPSGFHPVGTVAGDGPQLTRPGGDVPEWGKQVVRAQERRQMKFRIKLDSFPPEMVAAMFGERAALAMQFANLYRPMWFLGGDA